MKYSIILFLSFFVLTGCFEKKPAENIGSGSEVQVIEGENIVGSGTEISATGSLENLSSEENPTTETPEVSSGTDATLSASGSSGNEQEVIEEYEDDLEALFNDILKSE